MNKFGNVNLCTEQNKNNFGTKKEGACQTGSRAKTKGRRNEARNVGSQRQSHQKSAKAEIRRKRRDKNVQQGY